MPTNTTTISTGDCRGTTAATSHAQPCPAAAKHRTQMRHPLPENCALAPSTPRRRCQKLIKLLIYCTWKHWTLCVRDIAASRHCNPFHGVFWLQNGSLRPTHTNIRPTDKTRRSGHHPKKEISPWLPRFKIVHCDQTTPTSGARPRTRDTGVAIIKKKKKKYNTRHHKCRSPTRSRTFGCLSPDPARGRPRTNRDQPLSALFAGLPRAPCTGRWMSSSSSCARHSALRSRFSSLAMST